MLNELRPLLLLALLLLGACGTARSGPSTNAILNSDAARSYDVLELSAANIAPYLAVPRAAAASGGTARRPSGLALAPSDVLRVTVFERSDGGLFAPMTAGGSVFQAVRVDEAGMISLPYAGRIRVGGSNLARVQALIRGALSGKAVDPEVHVELVANPSHAVLVTGEVKSPGLVTTLDGPLSAVEAIARSGGPALPAHSVEVTIRDDAGSRRVPYLQLLSEPPVYVGRGNQVVLAANRMHFVAMGAVRSPGLQEISKPGMSLLDGIAQAGSLNDNAANPRGVFVFRLPPEGPQTRPVVVQVDFAKPESLFLARQFALRPDDTIYVTNAPVYEFQKLIAPLVQALIIGRSSAALAGS